MNRKRSFPEDYPFQNHPAINGLATGIAYLALIGIAIYLGF